MNLTRRLYTSAIVAAVTALTVVSSAFAAPGDPPSFDVSTLTPKLNDFGTALLAGLVILIGAVLIIKVPFVIVNVAMRTVRRLFGSSAPKAS
jgi:hypothetical protein